jgi:LPXTG-motif cell wall-anchored protein
MLDFFAGPIFTTGDIILLALILFGIPILVFGLLIYSIVKKKRKLRLVSTGGVILILLAVLAAGLSE